MRSQLLLLAACLLVVVAWASPQSSSNPQTGASLVAAFSSGSQLFARSGAGLLDALQTDSQGLELSLLIVGGGLAGLVTAAWRRRLRSYFVTKK